MSAPFRSANDTSRSIHRPSTWWNIGECVASLSTRIDATRRDDLDRRRVRFHVAHLDRRRVRAQHHAAFDVERVLHRAGAGDSPAC